MKFSARLWRATWLMACVIITVTGTLRPQRFKFHYPSRDTCLLVRLGNSLPAVPVRFSVSLCLLPQVGGAWQRLMSAINYKEQQTCLDRRQLMFNDFVRFINFTHRIRTHQTRTQTIAFHFHLSLSVILFLWKKATFRRKHNNCLQLVAT